MKTSPAKRLLAIIWEDRQGYPFDDFLAEALDRGDSPETITAEINRLLDGDAVSSRTVRRWLDPSPSA